MAQNQPSVWASLMNAQAQSLAPRANMSMMQEEAPDSNMSPVPAMTEAQVKAGVASGALDPAQPVQVVKNANSVKMKMQMPNQQQQYTEDQRMQDMIAAAQGQSDEAFLQQQQGIQQLEEGINQMRANPKKGIDYTPFVSMAKFLSPETDANTSLAAANALRPEAPEARADKLLNLQNMLQQRKENISKQNLDNLKEQIAAYKASKVNPLEQELTLSKIRANNALAGQKQDGAKLPETAVQKISDFDDSIKDLDNMEGTLNSASELMGPVEGRMNANNPWNEKAQIIQADLKRTAQKIGKTMEGGVLRKEDEVKYEKMLPNLSDTPTVAKAKWAQIRNMLATGRNQYKANMGKATYNTKNFGDTTVNPRPSDGAPDFNSMTDEQINAFINGGQ